MGFQASRAIFIAQRQTIRRGGTQSCWPKSGVVTGQADGSYFVTL